MSLHSYLAQDRLQAIANGQTLPDRMYGSALFADISGFSALTESLRQQLGSRKGAEALTIRLTEVYAALIKQIEHYGGSVIGFAGDSMLCWFANRHKDQSVELDTAARALAAAFGLQTAIKAFSEMALKVSVASGPVRRMVVGDPDIQRMDTLVGATVERTASAEQLAHSHEILADTATVQLLEDMLSIDEWRGDSESHERFAVISSLNKNIATVTPGALTIPSLEDLRPWIHADVFHQENSSQSHVTSEFRPCVALFIRFSGIDFESDHAAAELDSLITKLQNVANRYHGMLIDLTIGDKGSYAYLNFGALQVHEDDARRAVKTALELQQTLSLKLQMGISQGTMLVGAFGGVTRKTFNAFSNEVNLAARLMMSADEREILVSSHVQKAVTDIFNFEPRQAILIKGMEDSLPVFAVTGERHKRAMRLQEPEYALPMVGRQVELQLINEKLDKVIAGESQIIGITAEAGMGKSRLVAEVIRSARGKGFKGLGGACQSDGTQIPYLCWKSIWQAFFNVDTQLPQPEMLKRLEAIIEAHAPERIQALPLLNAVLDSSITDNAFTKSLEPRHRQSLLHALLEDCLKSQAKQQPTLIVIEDLHWIDPISHDLLESLVRSLFDFQLCVIIAYRPPELHRLQVQRIETLSQFTAIGLVDLTAEEAANLASTKLQQLYPESHSSVPAGLLKTLIQRAQGNPFYLEELLNYLHDHDLQIVDIQHLELPDSLHALILSRIDQLSHQEKTTLQVASVIGRLFRAEWLSGYYQDLGDFSSVKASLDQLESLEITPLDTPEPELAYLFKHIVTHEVTYQSLPFATRARLHEKLGWYLEQVEGPLEHIAQHYQRSENLQKKREYLYKAAQAAQKNYVNEVAIEHYTTLIPLLDAKEEKSKIHRRRGNVLSFTGNWEEAEKDYLAALATSQDDPSVKTDAEIDLGKLCRLRGDYSQALEWFEKAKTTAVKLQDLSRVAKIKTYSGLPLFRIGNYKQARLSLIEGLELSQQVNDKMNEAIANLELGMLEEDMENYVIAREMYEKSLSLSRVIGDRKGISSAINNLGATTFYQGDMEATRNFFEQSLSIDREIGDKHGVATVLSNIGVLSIEQGDYNTSLHTDCLRLGYELGDKFLIHNVKSNLASAKIAVSDYPEARQLLIESLELAKEHDNPVSIAHYTGMLGIICWIEGNYPGATKLMQQSLQLSQQKGFKLYEATALLFLGLIYLYEKKFQKSRENIQHSLRLSQESGNLNAQTSCLIGMAALLQHHEKFVEAVKMLGLVDKELGLQKIAIKPELILFHGRLMEKLKNSIDANTFQTIWTQGSRWTLQEAVNQAILFRL